MSKPKRKSRTEGRMEKGREDGKKKKGWIASRERRVAERGRAGGL